MVLSLCEVEMNTNAINPERISAFVDGELDEGELDILLKALYKNDNYSDWEIYHQIGDALRSDELAINLSSGFSERMREKLANESSIVAPTPHIQLQSQAGVAKGTSSFNLFNTFSAKRRLAFSGLTAIAFAATTFIAAPNLMVAGREDKDMLHNEIVAVSHKHTLEMASDKKIGMQDGDSSSSMINKTNGEVVLRDPRIDDYLLAHQSFSPSVYSTAQYARSATFATDSNK